MRVPTAFLVAAAFLLAGCMGNGNGADNNGTPGPDQGSVKLSPPWWNIGESWTVTFKGADGKARTTTLVNFANNTFNDPNHFWLGVTDRNEALSHVFFDDNPFLGRIHWVILAPHEKGMHSAMYEWPLGEGTRWTSPILLGKEDLSVEATAAPDGRILVEGEARADGACFAYDYDPALRWFRHMAITEADGGSYLDATVTDHKLSGAKGTYYFLRGRDYLDASGGSTGKEEPFTVAEEGATSIAFLLDIQTTGPSALEFIDPTGAVIHRETLALGGTADKVVEISKTPNPGSWKLRYVGSVTGTIKVRGVIEYKATL
jgi:hypothetical protein